MTFYKLRIDRQKTYMRVQIAFNSDYIEYFISQTFERKNMEFIDSRNERGKIMITFSTKEVTREYIYLIFRKLNSDHENSLYNYVFKYINAKDIKDFIDFKIKDSEELEYQENIKLFVFKQIYQFHKSSYHHKIYVHLILESILIDIHFLPFT